MKRLLIIKGIIVAFVFFVACEGYAAWKGPSEIVSSKWGAAAGQVGIKHGDSGDSFARSIGVSQSGKIVIADPINGVLHIFGGDGVLQRDIQNSFVWRGWPADVLVNSECAVVGYVQFTQTFNIVTGVQIGKVDNMGGADYVANDCSAIYSGGSNGWKIYLPTGQIIKTMAEMPLELGLVKSTKGLPDGSRHVVIQYDDVIYSINPPTTLEYFSRDLSKNLYGIIITGPEGNQYCRVYKYNKCGKVLGSVDLPPNNIVVKPNTVPPQPTPDVSVLAEYGQPIIAPSGDVYAWKRTPDTYSILKWTWVDDPNVPTGPDAPTNLAVAPTVSGLYLTWQASPHDLGCVTNYEISRATSAGGVYSSLTTVNAGVLKYSDATASAGTTYFYKIRAVAGSEYSPYTNEVSGKR